MSVESQVATLLDQAAENIDLPRQLRVTADAKITEIGNAFVARQNSMVTNFFVDPINGLDTNSGLTLLAPLRSIQRAIALTPVGGSVTINLMNDVTINWDASNNDVYIENRAVRIQSSSTVQRKIYVTPGSFTVGAQTFRRVAGFTIKNRVKLDFFNVNLFMPDTGSLGGNLANLNASIVHIAPDDLGGGHSINLASCNIDAPATPYGALIGLGTPAPPISLFVGSGVGVTNSGVIDGKWFDGVTTSTATSGLKWLVTNRATV